MRHVVGERAKDNTAASVSQMRRFETEILTQPQNFKSLINQPGQWGDEVHERKSIKEILRYFRGEAAFANPDIYCLLEMENYFYVIRLKGNNLLHDHIEHLLTRPVGRPPRKPIVQYHSFQYQAASWDIARRVVAKIE